MSLSTATLIGSLANWGLLASLIVGVISTFLIVQTTDVKEEHWDTAREQSRLRIAELDNETTKLRNKLAPRLLTKSQQEEIAARLKPFGRQSTTVEVAPWSPESQDFVDTLIAALQGAGWQVNLLPTRYGPNIESDAGVFVLFKPIDEKLENGPVKTLVAFLESAGIEARGIAAPSDKFIGSNDIAIIVSVKR